MRLARQAPISLKNERQFQANIAKLHSLNHPNIVAFLGACCWKVASLPCFAHLFDSAQAMTDNAVIEQSGKRSVVVTEFMDKSDLRMLLGRPDLASKFAWVSPQCLVNSLTHKSIALTNLSPFNLTQNSQILAWMMVSAVHVTSGHLAFPSETNIMICSRKVECAKSTTEICHE